MTARYLRSLSNPNIHWTKGELSESYPVPSGWELVTGVPSVYSVEYKPVFDRLDIAFKTLYEQRKGSIDAATRISVVSLWSQAKVLADLNDLEAIGVLLTAAKAQLPALSDDIDTLIALLT